MAAQTLSEIIRKLEVRAPVETAENWDNVGLLVGDPEWKTLGAIVSVDLTEDSILAAERKGFRLIINHHPCIFPKSRGLTRVVKGSGGTRGLLFEALRKGIGVATFHTNFDRSALEVVHRISEELGATAKGRLHEVTGEPLFKLVVFIPAGHLEKVRQAVCEAGAGNVGNYDLCTFGTLGEGTFRGGVGTSPFIGRSGLLEQTPEIRMETVFPRCLQKRIISALLQSHPYEEVAYDLYPVVQTMGAEGLISGTGYGFWGDFPAAKPFAEVTKDVRRLFHVNGFLLTEADRYSDSSASQRTMIGAGASLALAAASREAKATVRKLKKGYRRVGFVAGKGASFVESAAAVGCDLFITGEVGYHSALEGSRRGMTILELGHRESERFFLVTMKNWLSKLGLRTMELNIPTQKFVK